MCETFYVSCTVCKTSGSERLFFLREVGTVWITFHLNTDRIFPIPTHCTTSVLLRRGPARIARQQSRHHDYLVLAFSQLAQRLRCCCSASHMRPGRSSSPSVSSWALSRGTMFSRSAVPPRPTIASPRTLDSTTCSPVQLQYRQRRDNNGMTSISSFNFELHSPP